MCLDVLFIQWGPVERSHNVSDVEEDALPIHLPALQNTASPLDSAKEKERARFSCFTLKKQENRNILQN